MGASGISRHPVMLAVQQQYCPGVANKLCSGHGSCVRLRMGSLVVGAW